MLCIVFMEVSSGQLTKYISGGKKTLFNSLPDGWTTSFIFLILTLAAAQVNKNTMQGTTHLMQWQPHGTVTDEYS